MTEVTFKVQTAKQIGTLVDKAIAHTLKGDALIHEAAVQCLFHAGPKEQGGNGSGDVTLLERLVKGLGKSVRVQGLRAWITKFSPIAWNGDDKWGMLKKGDKGFKAFNLADALANPFWTLEEATETAGVKPPLSMDALLSMIEKLGGRIDKAVAPGGVGFEGDPKDAKALISGITTFAKSWMDANYYDNSAPPANEEAPPVAVAAPEPETVAQRAPRRRVAKAA